jgi:hypothetical protein
MSLPANRSGTAPGPVPITIINERKVKVIMPLSVNLPADGSHLSIAVGKIMCLIMKRCTWNRCGKSGQPGWRLCLTANSQILGIRPSQMSIRPNTASRPVSDQICLAIAVEIADDNPIRGGGELFPATVLREPPTQHAQRT